MSRTHSHPGTHEFGLGWNADGFTARLLNRICTVLSGQPYTVVGAPVILAPPTAEPVRLSPLSRRPVHQYPSQQPAPSTDVPTLILALDTLQTFNFTGHTFTRVIHSCVLPYLKHDDRDFRLKACETCCALLGGNEETKGKKKAVSPSSSPGEGAPGGGDKTVVHHQSNESVGFIAEVLQALIGVVIVDKGKWALVFLPCRPRLCEAIQF